MVGGKAFPTAVSGNPLQCCDGSAIVQHLSGWRRRPGELGNWPGGLGCHGRQCRLWAKPHSWTLFQASPMR
ncbi:unnamed protein product [Ciceribacter sp. T2.26MG-112.2]|nr:unnamed protein product [Ciceribacter naphthalenivorans]